MSKQDKQKKTVSKIGRPIGIAKSGGRTAGTPNKNTLSSRMMMIDAGFNPIQFLMELAKNEETPIDIRYGAATKLLEYYAPKFKPIEIPIETEAAPKADLVKQIRAEAFGYHEPVQIPTKKSRVG